MVAGCGEADAVAVTGKQYRADLVFQLFDSPRNTVPRHAQPARCSAETAGPRHLKENPNALPVRASAVR